MKVERIKPKPEFVPIVITLESQEEIDKLFAVVNHTTISNTIGIRWFELLRRYRSNNYIKYHNKLNEAIE